MYRLAVSRARKTTLAWTLIAALILSGLAASGCFLSEPNPNGGRIGENPDAANPNDPNNPANPNLPGGPGGPGSSGDPGSSGNPGGSEGPGNSGDPGGTGSPDGSGHPGGSMDPGDSEDPENPDVPEYYIRCYQDGTLLPESSTPDFSRDIKKIAAGPSGIQLIDYPKGYMVNVPTGMKFDFSCSPDYTRIYGKNLEIRISRDTSPYAEVKWWISTLPNEYITDKTYREANDITVYEDGWTDIGGWRVRLFRLTRTPSEGSAWTQNSYAYAYIHTAGLTYFTLHFRSDSQDTLEAVVRSVIGSFQTFEPQGKSTYKLDFHPVLPKWSEETAALYERIRGLDHILWGFFTPNPFTPEGKAKRQEVEERLDFEFPVIMWYRYLGHEFPLDGMLDAYAEGKLVELTYQIGGDLYGRNPNFDVLDGKMLDDIRMFARGAKEFGHPFLFRLNNEMNSTWVSYSGHLSLCDPDIFIEIWRTVYRIFQEEGVDNAIWIWNPNDVSYPPCKWNSHVAYYPGRGCCQKDRRSPTHELRSR